MIDSAQPIFRNALLVGAGGFAGAISRYLIGLGATHWLGARFPWGTLIVNVVGSFGLAVLLTVTLTSSSLPRNLQLAIGTGFFGAFTTFSTFSYETWRLVEFGPGNALLNVALNVLLCLAAAFAGSQAARIVAG